MNVTNFSPSGPGEQTLGTATNPWGTVFAPEATPSMAGLLSATDKARLDGLDAELAGKMSYSTTEQLTGGTWIDGKPIYRRVFDVGPLPNRGQVAILNVISDFHLGVHMYGFAWGGYQIPLPFVGSVDGMQISLHWANTGIWITTTPDWDWSSFNGYIVAEYTKFTN